MIKLRHKQTGKEWNYSATVWFKKGYDIGDYEILEWNNVVELIDNSNNIPMGKMERYNATKIIDEKPYISYRLEDVPRPDLKPSLLPINSPAQNAIITTNEKIKPVISKIFKNDYIKYTIITIFSGIVIYFIYEFFKYIKW